MPKRWIHLVFFLTKICVFSKYTDECHAIAYCLGVSSKFQRIEKVLWSKEKLKKKNRWKYLPVIRIIFPWNALMWIIFLFFFWFCFPWLLRLVAIQEHMLSKCNYLTIAVQSWYDGWYYVYVFHNTNNSTNLIALIWEYLIENYFQSTEEVSIRKWFRKYFFNVLLLTFDFDAFEL